MAAVDRLSTFMVHAVGAESKDLSVVITGQFDIPLILPPFFPFICFYFHVHVSLRLIGFYFFKGVGISHPRIPSMNGWKRFFVCSRNEKVLVVSRNEKSCLFLAQKKKLFFGKVTF